MNIKSNGNEYLGFDIAIKHNIIDEKIVIKDKNLNFLLSNLVFIKNSKPKNKIKPYWNKLDINKVSE